MFVLEDCYYVQRDTCYANGGIYPVYVALTMSSGPVNMSLDTRTTFSEPLCITRETFNTMLWTFTIPRKN
jgi:hypothetical protein